MRKALKPAIRVAGLLLLFMMFFALYVGKEVSNRTPFIGTDDARRRTSAEIDSTSFGSGSLPVKEESRDMTLASSSRLFLLYELLMVAFVLALIVPPALKRCQARFEKTSRTIER